MEPYVVNSEWLFSADNLYFSITSHILLDFFSEVFLLRLVFVFCRVTFLPKQKTNSPQNFVATIESEGVVAAQLAQLAWVGLVFECGAWQKTQNLNFWRYAISFKFVPWLFCLTE